jgi:hypothetical protein
MADVEPASDRGVATAAMLLREWMLSQCGGVTVPRKVQSRTTPRSPDKCQRLLHCFSFRQPVLRRQGTSREVRLNRSPRLAIVADLISYGRRLSDKRLWGFLPVRPRARNASFRLTASQTLSAIVARHTDPDTCILRLIFADFPGENGCPHNRSERGCVIEIFRIIWPDDFDFNSISLCAVELVCTAWTLACGVFADAIHSNRAARSNGRFTRPLRCCTTLQVAL